MQAAPISSVNHLIQLALTEDLGERGDITSIALGEEKRAGFAKIVAKQKGVVCGLEIMPLIFKQLDSSVEFVFKFVDGARVGTGDLIVELRGPMQHILIAERTMLNFLGRLSGIATLTRQFVDAVAGTNTKIFDTRKTTPGWRLLEKYAVKCGGGENHRIGLYDMFLIKENHIMQAGGIANAVLACRRYMESKNLQSMIEVEARTNNDVLEAMSLSVDRIMLDNMSLDQMRECVAFVNGRIPLEASGNVDLTKVRQFAETGVDFISIGALTHSPPVFDFSLLLQH